MVQARQLSREAMEMMEEAEKKCATAEDNVIAVRERATTCVRVERAIQAKQEANHEEKVKAILQKRDQEYEAAINYSLSLKRNLTTHLRSCQSNMRYGLALLISFMAMENHT
jgi:adenine-specific DNA methylase